MVAWGGKMRVSSFFNRISVQLVTLASIIGALGTPPANATNEYVGMTFERAVQAIKANGQRSKVVTRLGNFLPLRKCLVTGSRNSNSLDSSGNSNGDRVLIDLDCNAPFATAERPGHSIASPEGRAALSAYKQKLAEDKAAWKAAQKAAAEEVAKGG